ncbi:MAG: Galactokinase [Verrucomicrobiales bacterium]|nr:Galactokinase [Verrucomicrobiales bacterium]
MGNVDPALEVKQLFKEKFGHTPTHVVKAPGRLELLGNHTDYNEGLVMSLAVDKYILIASSPRRDGKIELVSSAFPEREIFSISELKKNPEAPWADYVKGVLNELRRHNVHFGGFSAAIHGTLPMGAGMSSSAALEVATATTVRQLYPFCITDTGSTNPPQRDKEGALPEMSREQKTNLAKLCQRAENEFVGVKCGILDQISSLFGKVFHAIEIDCQTISVEHVPMIGEIAIIICNSGVKHSLVGGEYNELREMCESAAKKIGVRALRAVDLKMLTANKAKLNEREYQCAYHVVGEIQRVIAGAKALREDDFPQFGQYMFQSHESSRDYFKNSTKELDLLVELARQHPGILGARLTGGGFGGATINLVKRNAAQVFCEFMAAEYEKKTGIKMTPLLCQIVDGAH